MPSFPALYHRSLMRLMARYYIDAKNDLDRYNWALHARPEQKLPSGSWRTWLIMAGRGYGKTRTGAESIRCWMDAGKCKHVALIGRTLSETRHIMVEGESGLLNIYPDSQRPHFYPSKRFLVWKNGAKATLYAGDQPDQLRGPQFDGAWVDEIAKYTNPQETWNQLNLALRLGDNPQVIVTTTPRPLAFLEDLVEASRKDPLVRLTQGTTYDNFKNLAKEYQSFLQQHYEGTLLGVQEIHGTLLNRRDQSLWKSSGIDPYRFRDLPPLRRIVIGIDPAATNTVTSDETGIIVAGIDAQGHGYVLEDLSGKYAPREWAQKAIKAYKQYQADRIVAETNKGGDMIEDLLRAQNEQVSFKPVRATRGKSIRAEPVAALYEKGRVHHCLKGLHHLEEQMLSYIPEKTSKSPDRIDALVWALTELMLRGEADMTPHAWIV